MEAKFKAPTTKQEFEERANLTSVRSTKVVIEALEAQRANKVNTIDDEIKFHKEVIEYLQEGELPERFGI